MYYRPKIFFPKKTYSMYGEDLIIQNFFKKKTKGFYVDIGCYHPLDGSNTFLLYKKGWNGINVDLNKISIDLFNKARKKDENFNLAISNKKKKLKIFFRKKINMLNTSSRKLAKIHFRNGFQEKIVESNTLNSILKGSRFKNKRIDFLNIDTEKSEVDVLQSLNFNKYKPKLICIEIHLTNKNKKKIPLKKHSTYIYLKKKKYKKVWNKGYSFIFAPIT